jgi:hypothetical protein
MSKYFVEERPLHPFLFMGCWNQPGPARDAVAAAIQNRSEEMLVLGGDNIYPEKFHRDGEKRKVYNTSVLDDGIELLGNKTIYASLGNHNVNVPEILDYEMEMSWVLPYSYYCAQFGDGYALVVLDTNLEGSDLTVMIDWFKTIQKKLMDLNIPYYLVQHEPYASYKKGKKQVLLQGAALLESITYSPIAVLCADTHNYQRGTLRLANGTLEQYVVGTGGAHHDTLGAAVGDSFTFGDISYRLDDHVPGYGFLVVHVGNTEFVHVADWPTIGGRTRKQKRATRKTLRRVRKNKLV